MSNRRAIVYLVLLLLAAVGANLWLDLGKRGEVVRRGSLLATADRATVFEFAAPGKPPVRLEKTDCWRIVSPFRAEADQTSVARLVDALAFAPVVDSMKEADALKLGRTLREFGLDSPRLTLRVFDSGRETAVAFGAENPSREGVYAELADSPVIYLVPSNAFAAIERPVDSWRRRSVFRVTPDEVQSIDIRRGDSPAVRIVRKGDRWEVVEPRQAMASLPAVKRIIDTVLSCEAKKFVWPVGASNETASASVALLTGYGLDSESGETVVFHAADGRDHLISFGATAGEDSVYALVHGGAAIATVAAEAKSAVSVDAGALIDGRLFPIEKAAVKKISLTDGESAYLLARGDDGKWRLDSPVSAAADEAAVSAMLDKLLVMRTADLEENGVKVSLSDDQPPVSVAREAFLGDGGFEQLRSKSVLDIDPATVKRLVVASVAAGKPASVVYDPDRKGWNVEASGRPGVIDQDRLTAFLAALSPLKAKSVARLKVTPGELAKFGLETPSFTIAIDRLLEDSVRRNILLGDVLDDSGDIYATVGATDAVFVLDGETVKILVSGVLDE